MLTLHHAPDNASLVLRLAMEEAAIPYDTALVDRAARGQKAPAYLALNPAGRVPTLVTPEGPIFETGACLLWLCDRHPGSGLGPSADDPRRGSFLRWLFYLSSTVHPDLNRVFYPDRYVPPEVVPAHHAMMAAQLRGHLRVLDAAFRDEPDLFAPPSALALYLGPLLRWSALYPAAAPRWLALSEFPALHALALALDARPAARAAAAAEGLGDAPFSDPRPPDPPEGSAT